MDTEKIAREKKTIEEALVKGLQHKGIKAWIQMDENALLGTYHLFVISEDFRSKDPLERENMVWDIIRSLPKHLAVKISMLFAITEDELKDVKSSLSTPG